MRACKAAAAKSGACHPAPWHDYATGRVRDSAQAPAPAVRDGIGAAMKPRAGDVAHFVSPHTGRFPCQRAEFSSFCFLQRGIPKVLLWYRDAVGMHRILWTEWPLESSQGADPAASPCVTAPAGVGYDLRMAQATRLALLRACAADAVLRVQVKARQSGKQDTLTLCGWLGERVRTGPSHFCRSTGTPRGRASRAARASWLCSPPLWTDCSQT